MASQSSGLEHGTPGGYNRGCRCEECREAMLLARKLSNHRALRAMTSDRADKRHGTIYGYQCGCRCERCCAAESERMRARYREAKGAHDGR